MQLSRDEFQKLALEQMDSVDRLARALTRKAPDADDLVQETYLRAFRAAGSFELRSFGMRPWLLRILHNLHCSRSIRESLQPKTLDTQVLQSFEDPDPDNSSDVPELTIRSDSELEKAMTEISEELRSVILLWAVDELSYKEIASVLSVPIGTVMSRLHRARAKLARLLRHPATPSPANGIASG